MRGEELPDDTVELRLTVGVNITIGWDGWAGRATLHDTDARRDADTFRCTRFETTINETTINNLS